MPEQDAQFVDSGQALCDMGVKMTGAFLFFLNCFFEDARFFGSGQALGDKGVKMTLVFISFFELFLRMPSSWILARPSVIKGRENDACVSFFF